MQALWLAWNGMIVSPELIDLSTVKIPIQCQIPIMLTDIIMASKLSQHTPHRASDNAQSSLVGRTWFTG